MARGKIFLVFSLFFILPLAHGEDAPSASPSPGAISTGGRGHKGGSGEGKRSKGGSATKKGGATLIQGTCSIEASPMNPISGACVNLVIVLNDSEGKQVLKNRTNPQGQFEFEAEPKKEYRLDSGSRYYEVLAPKELIHGGARVNLVLKQK